MLGFDYAGMAVAQSLRTLAATRGAARGLAGVALSAGYASRVGERARAAGESGAGARCGPRAAGAAGGARTVRVMRAGPRPDPAVLRRFRSPGVCLTAQRTIRNSATIGIFRKTISQMKVQRPRRPIIYP